MTLRRPALTSSENAGPYTPLRLSVAAAIAFPDRSISESSLRREAKRARLTVEIFAGKVFTTLNEIERMRGRYGGAVRRHEPKLFRAFDRSIIQRRIHERDA